MGPFVIAQALWLFLPAYGANMAPVFAAKVFPRWNARIDGGRQGKDGRPLLGESKTWRGLWSGAVVGSFLAFLQSGVRSTNWDLNDFGYEEAGPFAPLALGFALGWGAVVGDTVKSYFKRRLGKPRGKAWVPFDQLDFAVGGLFMVFLMAWLLDVTTVTTRNWLEGSFLAHPGLLLTVLLLTPFLHFGVNVIGYKLRLKREPW